MLPLYGKFWGQMQLNADEFSLIMQICLMMTVGSNVWMCMRFADE